MKTKNEIVEWIKKEGIEIPEMKIWIIPEQKFNGKIYSQIINEIPEDFIAPYRVLQPLRNIAFESGWKKYSFMKDVCAFVPNPDKVSESNSIVSYFGAGGCEATLESCEDPLGMNSDLGVFLYCPIEEPQNPKKGITLTGVLLVISLLLGSIVGAFISRLLNGGNDFFETLNAWVIIISSIIVEVVLFKIYSKKRKTATP